MTLLKHSEDRWPVACITFLTLLDLGIYCAVDSTWLLAGYWLLMLIPKGIISAWNHHHQHSLTFRYTPLNRALELAYTFHTGISSNLWLLHHVIGHHVHFLDQRRDESRWQRRDGKQMGVLEYTLSVAATSYYRAYQVGKRFPRYQRTFVTWTAIAALIAGSLVFLRPMQGLFILLLPMVCSLLFTCWVTYDHHAGLTTEDEFNASYNILNPWFNRLTGNLGYHTAHHHRQGIHWSQLPALHEEIKHRIPASCYRKTTFDVFLPGPEQRAVRHASEAQVPQSAAASGLPAQ